MKLARLLPLGLLAFCAFGAGCSGGAGGASSIPTNASAADPSSVTRNAAAVPLTVQLKIPTVQTSSTTRRLAYISAQTASVVGTVVQNGVTISTDTENCSSNCTLHLNAQAGQAAVTLQLFAGTGGSGALLSSGTAVSTIVSGQQNSVTVLLGGIVSSIALSLVSSNYSVGAARTDSLVVTAYDASGAQIIGTTPYTAPITLALSGDAAHEFQLGQTQIQAPLTQGVALVFNGGAVPESVSLTASTGQVNATPVPLVVGNTSGAQTSANLSLTTETPAWSDAFVNAIGVNVHLGYQTSPYYANYSTFRSLFLASGIRHIRDGVIDTTDQTYYTHLMDLAGNGIKATLITSIGQSAALIQSYPTRIPGVMEAIEGPNEYDLSGDPNWVANLSQFQAFLYQTVKAGAQTAQLPVIGPSLTSAQAYASLGNISAYADYGNMHNYFSGYNPGTGGWGDNGYGSIVYNQQIAAQATGSKPALSTETGYCTVDNLKNAVTPQIQGIYEPRMFLEQWLAGVPKTYGYEFTDEGPTGCFGNYGLTTAALAPKPAYTALTDMIALLNDKGTTFTPSAVQFQLGGATTNLHHLWLEKHDGTLILALWLEVPSWNVNAGNGAAVTVAPQSVTVALPTAPKISSAQVYDVNGNLTAEPLTWNASTTTVSVLDRVTFISLHE